MISLIERFKSFFSPLSKRKYILIFPFIFAIAAVLSNIWFFGWAAVGWFMGFGGALPTAMRMWEISYWGVYAVFVITLTFLFNRKGGTPFWATLVTALLPGLLFWGTLKVKSYRYDKTEQAMQSKYEEFKKEALELIPSTAEFLEAQYNIDSSSGNIMFAVELLANFDHEFDLNVLDAAFEFRIDDLENRYYESEIVPACKFYNHYIGIKPYTGTGNYRYKPGEYKVSAEWWFYGPNCTKDNFRSLSGKRLIIRSDSKVIAYFPIEKIEGINN